MTSPAGISLLVPLGASLAVVSVLVALGAPAWDALGETWWARVVFPAVFVPGIFALDTLHIGIPRTPLAALAVISAVNVLLWFAVLRLGFAAWTRAAWLARRRPSPESRNPFAWEAGDE